MSHDIKMYVPLVFHNMISHYIPSLKGRLPVLRTVFLHIQDMALATDIKQLTSYVILNIGLF